MDLMYDCISIGDCTFDVNLFVSQVTVENGKICLAYGEKIPVDSITRGLGGNAANNVVGLTRLGFKTALLTIFGDDQIGERIGQYLDGEKIDKSLVQVEKGTESRYSTIINFSGERTILAYAIDRKYKLPADFPETAWIFLSSVGPEYEEFFGEVASLVESKDIKLAFAPTGAQLSAPLSTYKNVVKDSQIIFLNKEEAVKMVGEGEIKKLLFGIRDLGAKTVVITDGGNGSYAYDGDKYYQVGIFKLPIVQRTGAGDAYAAGFLGAIFKGKTISEAMVWGAVNSASVIAEVGTEMGLLTMEKIDDYVAQNPEFKAEEI